MANIPGTAGPDTLNGTSGDDTITGGAGDDTINGLAGVDTAVVNASTDGADLVDLGIGLDRVNVTAAAAGQLRLTFTFAEVGDNLINDSNASPNQDGGLAVRFQLEDALGALTGAVSRYDDEGTTFVSLTAGLTFDVRDLVTGASRGDTFLAVWLGTSANDTLGPVSGTAANAAYYYDGGGGNDTLNAGGGADFLAGGLGNDTLNGGAGDDTAVFNLSTDGVETINLGAGADRLNLAAAAPGQIRVTFTSSEVGNGSATDSDSQAGQDGNLAVRLQLEGASDTVGAVVGRVDDEGITLVAASTGLTFDVRDLVSGAARGSLFTAVALGTNANDAMAALADAAPDAPYYFNAGAGDDTVAAGAGADFLVGGSGNDLLTGGLGADSFIGGSGSDTVAGGDGADVAIFNVSTDGADSVDLGLGADRVNVSAAAAGQVRLTFTSAEVGNGAALDSATMANQDGGLAVRLQAEDSGGGLSGPVSRFDDEAVVFVGSSTGVTFDVRDLVSGAARGDQFVAVSLGTSAADTLAPLGDTATGAAYYFNAGLGDDVVNAGSGADFLVGGSGADTLNGGAGADGFLGGAGNDSISGGDGDDTANFNLSTDGVDAMNLGLGADRVSVSAAAAGQVRITFTSAEVGDGSANDAGTLTNQDGGLAVRLQLEDGAGAATGLISRADDEAITFAAATAGLTFDVRDLVSGAARGDVFRTVTLGSSAADTLTGTAEADYVNGGAGADTVGGGDGADTLVGGTGADSLDGGAGADTAVVTGVRANYSVATVNGALQLTDNRAGGGDGVDTLSNIERVLFADGAVAAAQLSYETLSTLDRLKIAFLNTVGVDPDSAKATAATITLGNGSTIANPLLAERNQLSGLASQVDASTVTFAQALRTVAAFGDDTVSVATLAYQFFTDKTPSDAGYDYLVNSSVNSNDLTDPYYALFNLENRYINFAVNLGKAGEGQAAFQAGYGGLSLFDATAKAYLEIFGFDPPAGRIATILDTQVAPGLTRAGYFAAYGLDGPNGIGTKAAAVGFLLAEAQKAGLGAYADANENFLADVADGAALFNVDLLVAYAAPVVTPIGVPASAPADLDPLAA